MFDFILILAALLVAFYSAALAIDVMQKRRRRREYFAEFDAKMARLDARIAQMEESRSLFQRLVKKQTQKPEE